MNLFNSALILPNDHVPACLNITNIMNMKKSNKRNTFCK